MYRFLFSLIVFPVLILGCRTVPPASGTGEVYHQDGYAVTDEYEINEYFLETAEEFIIQAPGTVISTTTRITQEVYDRTLAEVQAFIEHLNTVIRNRDYNSWKNSLSSEYYAHISSPEFLREQSETPLMRTRRIVLQSSSQYFTTVVVPSRANSRVDEIEFADNDIVRAFHIDTSRSEPRRLRVYELRKVGNDWEITG